MPGQLTIGPYTKSEKERIREYELALASEEPEQYLLDIAKSRWKELMQPADYSTQSREERLKQISDLAIGMSSPMAIAGITREEMGKLLATFMKMKKKPDVAELKSRLDAVKYLYQKGRYTKEEALETAKTFQEGTYDKIMSEAENLATVWRHTPESIIQDVKGMSFTPEGVVQRQSIGVSKPIKDVRGKLIGSNIYMDPKARLPAAELYSHEVPGHIVDRWIKEWVFEKSSFSPEVKKTLSDLNSRTREAYSQYQSLSFLLEQPEIPSATKNQIKLLMSKLHKTIPGEAIPESMELLAYSKDVPFLAKQGAKEWRTRGKLVEETLKEAQDVSEKVYKKYISPRIEARRGR